MKPLPCPNGCNAKLLIWNENYGWPWHVECPSCGCIACGYSDTMGLDARDDAIRVWNDPKCRESVVRASTGAKP